MSDIYFELIEYIFFGLSAVFLIVSVVLFLKLRIPAVIRDLRGTVEQKQIERIRDKSTKEARRSSAMNVFEELEKQARPKTAPTRRIRADITGMKDDAAGSGGTILLKKNGSKDFVVEKSLMFVSTNDVLR